MRRSGFLAPLTLLLLLVLAAPAGGEIHEVRVSGFGYEPKSITIAPEDYVVWRFTGRDRNHTITSAPGQDESFESDPGRSRTLVNLLGHERGSIFSHRFVRPGAFEYFCRVHDFMRGDVRVRFPAADGGPADTRRPRIRSLRATPFCRRRGPGCRRRGIRFRFRLSEGSRVTVRISRGRRVFRRFSRRRSRGRADIRLRGAGLRAGLYRATFVATDGAGNRSAARRIRFRVPWR